MSAETVWTGTVTGMTCAHCVVSVTEEITEIPGVDSVEVSLETGLVTVVSETPLPTEAIAAAVSEAGYTLSPS